MSLKQLRAVLRKTTDVQVDSVWMKLGSYYFGSRGEQIMLTLVAQEDNQKAWLRPRKFSYRQLMEGTAQGDELVLKDDTRLRFFKLAPINLE